MGFRGRGREVTDIQDVDEGADGRSLGNVGEQCEGGGEGAPAVDLRARRGNGKST